jgi:Pretoxin HINT domain
MRTQFGSRSTAASLRRRNLLPLTWVGAWCLVGFYFLGVARKPPSPAPRRPGASGVTSCFSPTREAPRTAPSRFTAASPQTKAIEDVRAGDFVLAFDDGTGLLELGRVSETYRRVANHLRILQLKSAGGTSQELRTTDEHPFWVVGSRWTRAADLSIGEKVLQSDGSTAIVARTVREEHPDGVAVFNFEVEGFHDYFVAEASNRKFILAHNCGPGYRVMSQQEFTSARNSGYSDSRLVRGDPDEMGNKWLWGSPESARKWQAQVNQWEPESQTMIARIPTRWPIDWYPSTPHPPQGPAYHVPFGDLGPPQSQ